MNAFIISYPGMSVFCVSDLYFSFISSRLSDYLLIAYFSISRLMVTISFL